MLPRDGRKVSFVEDNRGSRGKEKWSKIVSCPGKNRRLKKKRENKRLMLRRVQRAKKLLR